MPTAAGTGAIPTPSRAPAAAGQGAAAPTVQQAREQIQDTTTLEDLEAVLDRVEQPLAWYRNARGQLTLEYLRATVARPFQEAKDWVIARLAANGGRRKTRAKRKHFRKRTSRRT